jgi:hypothetical protein
MTPPALTRLDDLEPALAPLLRSARPSPPGSWDLAQVLAHCAQSIEYSMTGYPRLRSALFRALVGPVVKRRFIRRGRMSHDRSAPVPGAPELERLSLDAAAARLRAAIAAFRAFDGPLAPPLAYGRCTKADYDTLHALHLADHLEIFARASG